ncbi:MAG TPA: hypothetical protein DCP97_04830 [Ruminococcaceae bacterium]|nr:hypothetical protein [Oscillospiraceae bacterium]
MLRSLYSGVSGLRSHQTRMDVIGNNIANVNTYGFKASRATFRDVYYQTMAGAGAPEENRGGTNAKQIGYGTQVATIDTIHSRSGFASTDSVLDIAISGEGYFQVMDPAGNKFYTRAGNFTVDAQGNLVDASGNFVLGAVSKFTETTELSKAIDFIDEYIIPNQKYFTDLDKALVTDGDTARWATFKAAYDDAVLKLNNPSTDEATLAAAKNTLVGADGISGVIGDLLAEATGTNSAPAYASAITGVLGGALTYYKQTYLDNSSKFEASSLATLQTAYNNAKSLLESGTATSADKLTAVQSMMGAAQNVKALDTSYGVTLSSGLLPTASGSEKINILKNINSTLPAGAKQITVNDLTSLAIGANGAIEAKAGEYGRVTLGRIDLATFANPQGLQQEGNSYFSQTGNSGVATPTIPGSDGAGQLASGMLEMSNVDLSKEFSDMITTQRGFQANSRIITVSDSMLEELVNLKR